MTFLFYSLKQHALLTSNLVITNMHLRLKTQKKGRLRWPSPPHYRSIWQRDSPFAAFGYFRQPSFQASAATFQRKRKSRSRSMNMMANATNSSKLATTMACRPMRSIHQLPNTAPNTKVKITPKYSKPFSKKPRLWVMM